MQGARSLRVFGLSVVCMSKDGLDLSRLICTCLSIRQPVNPRTRQQPPLEASPQEPEEPEEILGSDDEEQEDPHDYCKGESHIFSYSVSSCTTRVNHLIKAHEWPAVNNLIPPMYYEHT